MIKRRIALLLSIVMCCSAAVCGCSDSDSSSNSKESSKAEAVSSESDNAVESAAEESSADSEASKNEEPPKDLPTNIIDGIDYLTFVSHGYKLPDDWEEKIKKVTFVNGQDYEVTIEKRTYDAYMKLKEELENDGIFVDVDTGYRSVAEQVEIMQRYRERYGSEYAKNVVAVPGYSEHHTGLAIDLYLIVDGKPIIYNEDLVKYTDIWAKIHEKLAKYGFILHYMEGKEDITKFSYEPWHIRYVGEDQAKEITDKGLTLEEYLGVTVTEGNDVFEETESPLNRETIYQVALLQSLVQGYYDGVLSVDALKEKGDTGLGTFEGVNGEMIVIDGEVYRANSKGDIEKPEGDEMIPFSNVTFFEPDISLDLKDIKDIDALKTELNKVVDENKNMFYMVKVNGEFSYLKARSEPKQEKPYKSLDVALAETQEEFEFENMNGTLVALYCPDYMSDLNTVGWHFHFISDDRSKGGHVLQVSVKEAEAQLDMTPGFKVYMSDEAEFQKMELAKDVDEAIKSAETKSNDD